MSTPPDRPFLAVRHLHKAFPGVVALDDVSLDVAPGEVIGLVGKNGAGKSTLIRSLAGVVARDAGEIEIDGEVVGLTSPHEATRAGLAFVHQELAQAPNLSVAENVLLGLGYPRFGPFVRWGRLRAQVAEILARLDADIDPQMAVGRLSPARQRLVMIAHALAQRARLVVLDEPSAALTDDEIAHLHGVVARLSADGVAVIYISHRLDEILAVSDRIVVMRDARVVAERPAGTLTRNELIELITGSATEIAQGRAQRERPAPDARGEPLLRVRGLTAYDGPRDVSLHVHAGEILGLAGLVGSGRTELVRAIFGASPKRSGEVLVRGRSVSISSPRDAVASGLVLLPEDRRREGNVLDFSVQRNVTLVTLDRYRYLSWIGVPSPRREQREARRWMGEMGVDVASPATPVRSLSGGNQQKVMLAKWLAHGADVYMFDEPTLGIDVEAKEEVFRLIDAVAEQGKAVILISSDFSELVAVCDRVLTLREGQVVGELGAGEITEARLIEGCYANVAPA
jgi:ABC-type sugar transport system ATPase subunit